MHLSNNVKGGGAEGTYKQQFTVFIYLSTETFFLSIFTSLNVSSYNILPHEKSQWIACDFLFQNFPAIGAVFLSFQVSTL